MRCKFLKASYGDCYFIYVDYENRVFTILVDGGPKSAYIKRWRNRLTSGCLQEQLTAMKNRGEHIDLLIITHVDDDHIGGIKAWFEDETPSPDFVREVWMNDDMQIRISESLDNNAAEAASLKELMIKSGLTLKNRIVAGRNIPFEWGVMTILAPTVAQHNIVANKISAALSGTHNEGLNNAPNNNYHKDIKTLLSETWPKGSLSNENDASIAFILTTKGGERGLFLGDANIETVLGNLPKPVPQVCKLVKLSHHGSKYNFLPELLDAITTDQFVVLADGSYYGHPDKEVIAQIIDKTASTIFFNYIERGREMLTAQDRMDYPDILNRVKSTDDL